MAVKYINPIDAQAPRRCADKTIALAMETYSEELLSTMREVAPKRTGAMARGLTLRQIGRMEYLIEASEEYTDAVLYGHRRFWVEPKEGGVLHWTQGGRDIFSKGHWIPATEPQRFDLRAQDIERGRLPTYVGEAAALVRRSTGGRGC